VINKYVVLYGILFAIGNSWGGSQDLTEDSWGGGGGVGGPARKDQQFDIGTWENPGDTSANSAAAAKNSTDSSSWSTDSDNTKAWSTAATGWSAGGDGVGGGGENKDTAAAWSTGEIGHWGGGGEDSTPKTGKPGGGDWRNDSASSVELSPGSQWKKEVVSVGNWADAVPSPRSDQEDNPLNASLETVTRKIVW